MSEHTPTKVTPIVWDRTINLPFLATIGAAVFAVVTWTSAVNARLYRLEERTRALPEIEVKITRMDERGESSKAALARIEDRLNRQEQSK
ncbi:hypothetical protein [Brevundimonas sp.]|uniref:hypothetical protein n=1 Tax=Brevundimonas sp. TaxID=1871086 RepID=UPI001AD4DE8D|nr:hypothetical protein [Brevundimonas sp.]MBN9467026.1 hypothetical protein [Brevundimonas sp.]